MARKGEVRLRLVAYEAIAIGDLLADWRPPVRIWPYGDGEESALIARSRRLSGIFRKAGTTRKRRPFDQFTMLISRLDAEWVGDLLGRTNGMFGRGSEVHKFPQGAEEVLWRCRRLAKVQRGRPSMSGFRMQAVSAGAGVNDERHIKRTRVRLKSYNRWKDGWFSQP